jgi:hypothetical protein
VLSFFFVLPWFTYFINTQGVIGMYLDTRHVLIENESDVYDCLWHFWWVRTALDSGSDPRAYGETTLAWHNMGWPDLFISYITGAGYNVMLFFGAIFSALSGYLLARSWGVGRSGSIAAAFVIVWMPVRAIRMYQHYPIASIGYVVMTLLFVKKWIQEGSLKNAVFIVVFAALAVMESLYHGLIIVLGCLLTFILSGRKPIKEYLIAGTAVTAGCIMGSLWLLTAPGAFGQNPEKDWKEAVYWAAEPQSFVLPSFLGNPVVPGYMPSPFEGVVSPGITVAAFALVFCVMKKSWRGVLAVLAVVVLSMGPLFKINGVPTPVPLPYMVIAKLPWLSAARAPSRLAILVGIMAAIAAGAFIEKRKPLTGWLLTGLIILEITPFTVRSIENTVPHFYLSRNTNGVTLEIPSSDRMRRYSLFEIADGSPRLVRYLARGGEAQMEFIPASLLWGSTTEPTGADIIATGAETVVYNRWMFSDSIRSCYDSLYYNLFSGQTRGDSVWVWTAQ